MAEVIRMPLLSDTMKEGVIAEWHKKIGDKVKADDVIAEVETDKATMEVMPYVEGTLLYIGVEKGQTAPVNGIIAIIGKEGENYQSLLDNQPKNNSQLSTDQEKKIETKPTTSPPILSNDATVIRMPLLSDTMKEGKIVSWLKQIGDKVKSDDVLAEVETDKATMEVLPYTDGTLLHIGVEAGKAAKINEIIAIIGKEGTDISAFLTQGDQSSLPEGKEKLQPTITSGELTAESNNDVDDSRVKASPLARRIAKEKGIDLSLITGSGDGGRVIKRDLDNVDLSESTAPKAMLEDGDTKYFAQESHTDRPLSQMRKVIAQRLSESKTQAPHFYLRMSIKMDNAIEARKAMNEISPVKISFNDFIIKASSLALRKHPDVNSSWMGDIIRQNHHINIGTAVAIDDGLIVPVVKFADQKSLAQISEEAKTLIQKARDRKLQPQEFTGNTFTISNLGMMDIDEFTAIINSPDSCILAVGKIEPTPVVENSEIIIRQIMKLTLSCDHRVVDGAVGAAFLQTLKTYLENPVTMLV